MRYRSLLLVLCLLLAGCGSKSDQPAGSGAGQDPGSATSGGSAFSSSESSPAAISAGVAQLSPDNTRVEFTGKHTDDRPDRRGGFEKLSGTAEVDEANKSLKSVSVEIEADSVWTPISNLTDHLRTPDFLDSREYPTIRFQSTSIQPPESGNGQHTITGDLTLLKTTKEISFPATVTIDDQGLALAAEFTIDRTEFGMDKLQNQVTNDVSLSVAVGQKTQPQVAQGGFGGGGGRGRRGPGGGGGFGRGNFDPAAFFQRLDADGDGKLTGDEISEQMRGNMEAIDTDKSGDISLEEFQERMRQFGGGRGRGGPGGGGPPRPDRPQRPESES